MRYAPCGALGSLAFSLVLGATPLPPSRLPAPQLQALKVQQPQRTLNLLNQARSIVPNLGLSDRDSFAIRTALTTDAGRTVVRFNQTHDGYRVYGSGNVGHVEADGQMRVYAEGLSANVVPTGTPRLSPEEATAIALRQAGLKGQPLPPKVERVVFPTKFMDGLRTTVDPVTKAVLLDRNATVLSRPSSAYVWAYQVDVFSRNSQDGVTDMQYVIDAETGTLLRKIDNLRYEEAVPGTPAKGMGFGQYVGRVAIDTTQSPDGTFALRDQTRGSKPNPFFLNRIGIDMTGLTTMWEVHDDMWTFGNLVLYVGNPNNLWGDGNPFMDFPNEGKKNGETAAVDAHYGIGLTWDMYKNVFGRDGIDGVGTTPFALVHVRNGGTGGRFDNAFWSPNIFGMFFGDGTFLPDQLFVDETGMGIPGNPFGMMSLTELDIAGHELSHGLTSGSANLIYRGESGGLNESMSDIMGTMVEAYHKRTQDDEIPNYGFDWKQGSKCRPSGPLRHMDKPSLDKFSADAWYPGIDWMEVHYSSGPMNRCFYFLSTGASSDPTATDYSPYLPGGMTGIGINKAGHIVFKALTEYMVETTNYEEAGACYVRAAEDLFGKGSAEVAATKKALTAINVQVAGETKLTRVSFPDNTTAILGNPDYVGILSQCMVLPMGATVAPMGVVSNNTDTRTNWVLGGHRAMFMTPVDSNPTATGIINADGSWTSPMRLGFYLLTSQSKARPEQFCEGLTLLLDLDADADGEQDAIDMGATATSWFMSRVLKPAHSPFGGNTVDDLDVDGFQTAVKTAWGVK